MAAATVLTVGNSVRRPVPGGVAIVALMLALIGLGGDRVSAMELEEWPQDIAAPNTTEGDPAPGRRVRRTLGAYEETEIHHLLYLPVDWVEGASYPVIVEYAGNRWQSSLGTVEGSSLGYGISGGRGVIWLCLPFVDVEAGTNATQWWGDVEATIEYCIDAVEETIRDYGGDADNLFLAGFSRGAIAANFIGLHDDRIAALWCGFICHSHYEGPRWWPGSDPRGAARRLQRLGGRPQFISHETSVEATCEYLTTACPDGNFTFMALPFPDHTDTWVLRALPERQRLRDWCWDQVSNR